MSTSRESDIVCPRIVNVIGGGLWSRVIAGELCKILPSDVEIWMHSAHNHALLQAWAARQRMTNRVLIDSSWPDLEDGKSRALIIANAARDHAMAIERALPSQIPVLVEKPFTLTAEETHRLLNRATAVGSPLAASCVFLFARFFQRFVEIVEKAGAIEQIAFCWTDPAGEVRHGERKGYDSGLPLPVDVLPHISALVGGLLPGAKQSCAGIELARGGAKLNLEIRVGSVPCAVTLARNAAGRQRTIEVTTAKQQLHLNFTGVPTVTAGDQVTDLDPDWGIADGPLACMLKSFLNGAVTGVFDPRLSVGGALAGNELADQAYGLYRAAVSEWLMTTLPQPEPEEEEHLRYALREYYLAAAYRESDSVDSLIENLIKELRGATAEDVKRLMRGQF